MIDRAPTTNLITARALTGSLVELPSANRIATGLGTRLALWFEYTRGSAGGSLIARVEGASAAPDVDPTTITRWAPVPILDGSSFTLGRVAVYPLEVQFLPSPPTADPVWRRIGDLDVADLTHVRLLVGDGDGGAPGSVTIEYQLLVVP